MSRNDSPRSPRRPRVLARRDAARRSAGRTSELTLSNLRTLRWISPEVVTARRNQGGGVLIFLLGATGGDREVAIRALARGARSTVSRINVADLLARQEGVWPTGLPVAFALARRSGSLMVLDNADALFCGLGDRSGFDRLLTRLWQMIEDYPSTVVVATAQRPPVVATRACRYARRKL